MIYGKVARSPYANGARTLYGPDAVVGRMVESPTEIGDQLTDFRTAGGKLAAGTGLVTGYDVLSDGATQIKDEVGQTYSSVNSSLIRDDWIALQILSKRRGGKPEIKS